jgi:D-arginine dehydrogenase
MNASTEGQVSERRRITVIGGGIAGLSLAANVSSDGTSNVTVLEAEAQPGYHSSGRSAAVYIEPYMNRTVHALSRASLDFFLDPPGPFWSEPIVSAWDSVMIASPQNAGLVDSYLDTWAPLCPQLHELDVDEVLTRVPILRRQAVARAVGDPRAMAIDVHGLLDGFRRMLLAHGGRLRTNARVTTIERRSGHWVLGLAAGDEMETDVLVNAAGAWGDEVGQLAGVEALGLQPLRRTALLIGSEGHDIAGWPLLFEASSSFYLKPEAGQLLLSPSDETPSPPCDAQPEDLDAAMAVDRIQQATTLAVPRIERKWAGLRSFLPDHLPAVGYDEGVDGFFWLIGQGGFGMQTSAAMGRLGAALLEEALIPDDLAGWGIDAQALSPARLRT